MTAYYNEIDEYCAKWLHNLIDAGHIAPGVVDTRSITDVTAGDLKGFKQCHFFAGIGVWSYALRRAAWPDDRAVWTMSCPCQPFSSAGKGAGFDDERHLWPAAYQLIAQCRPPTVFGEQVASKDAEPWVDLVHADMEAMGYAFGCVPFPAASVGAPHIRDRNYWVGHAERTGLEGYGGHVHISDEPGRVSAGATGPVTAASTVGRLANASVPGSQRRRPSETRDASGTPWVKPERLLSASRLADADSSTSEQRGANDRGRPDRSDAQSRSRSSSSSVSCRLADTDGTGSLARRQAAESDRYGNSVVADGSGDAAHPTNGFWRDADWLGCRDGKFRPVESGTQPLAHGAPARVGRLRAYGNAINAEAAEVFIRSYLDATKG